jgi:hypothetical protein
MIQGDHPPSRHCMCAACAPSFEATPGSRWVHVGHIVCGSTNGNEIDDWEVDLNWMACEGINDAENGSGRSIHLFAMVTT